MPPRSSEIGETRPGLIARFGWPSIVLVAVEIMLVAAVLFGLYQYERATTARARSFQALTSIDQMLISLLDVETGMRGYVITGELVFLDPYRDAIEVVNVRHRDMVIALRRDGFDNEVLDRLTQAISLRLGEAGKAVTLRESGDVEGAFNSILSGNGRELMDDVRAQAAAIRAEEQSRLDDRSTRADTIGLLIGGSAILLAVVTSGLIVWLLVVLRRRQDQEALQRISTAKDEFVGFVSHELRTPIAIIAGNARVLEAQDLQLDTREEAVSEINMAADRLQDIVDTLLSLAKAESGAKLAVEPVLLHRIAGTVRRHHRRRHPTREIVISAQPDTPPALGDRVAIEQVLINLLSNAEKYGSHQGAIHVDVRQTDAGMIEIAVRNPGPVLDREQFARIFEPFFRMPAQASTQPGVGLGLTICHRLIAAQGGHMAAEALAEGGAVFRVELPAAAFDDE